MCWKIFKRCFLLDKGLFSVGMLGQVAYSWKVKDSMFSVGLKTDRNVFRGCRQSPKLLVESIYFKSATISYQLWRETLQLQPWFGILWIFESAWNNPHWRLNLQLRPVQIRFCFLWIIKVNLRPYTGEKTFNCHKCNGPFASSEDLKAHEGTHTGDKSFNHDQYKKALAFCEDLKVHERTHTGDKPFNWDHYNMVLCPMIIWKCTKEPKMERNLLTATTAMELLHSVKVWKCMKEPTLDINPSTVTSKKSFCVLWRFESA